MRLLDGQEKNEFLRSYSTEIREVQRILGQDPRKQRDPPDDQQRSDNQENDLRSPYPDPLDVDVPINTVTVPNKYVVVDASYINAEESEDTDIEEDTFAIPLQRYNRDEYANTRLFVDFECICVPPDEDRVRPISPAYLKHTVVRVEICRK